jgi:hypothetical protein
MVQITTDDSLLARDLWIFLDTVEIRDEGGKLLGVFVPANLQRAEQIRAEAAASIDHEEIARQQKANEPTYPYSEVRERLRILEAEVLRRESEGKPALTEDEAVAFIDHLRAQRHIKAG